MVDQSIALQVKPTYVDVPGALQAAENLDIGKAQGRYYGALADGAQQGEYDQQMRRAYATANDPISWDANFRALAAKGVPGASEEIGKFSYEYARAKAAAYNAYPTGTPQGGSYIGGGGAQGPAAQIGGGPAAGGGEGAYGGLHATDIEQLRNAKPEDLKRIKGLAESSLTILADAKSPDTFNAAIDKIIQMSGNQQLASLKVPPGIESNSLAVTRQRFAMDHARALLGQIDQMSTSDIYGMKPDQSPLRSEGPVIGNVPTWRSDTTGDLTPQTMNGKPITPSMSITPPQPSVTSMVDDQNHPLIWDGRKLVPQTDIKVGAKPSAAVGQLEARMKMAEALGLEGADKTNFINGKGVFDPKRAQQAAASLAQRDIAGDLTMMSADGPARDAAIQARTQQYLAAMNQNGGAAPAASPGGPKTADQRTQDAFKLAREAIAKGAPRAAVEERLRANGIDPKGL